MQIPDWINYGVPKEIMVKKYKALFANASEIQGIKFMTKITNFNFVFIIIEFLSHFERLDFFRSITKPLISAWAHRDHHCWHQLKVIELLLKQISKGFLQKHI